MKSKNTAILGVFTGLVIILQLVSNVVKPAGISITLALIPLVLVSMLIGPKWGAVIGTMFGLMSVVCVVVGLDVGSAALLQFAPIKTIIMCLFKGTLAGLVPGILYKVIKNKKAAAIVATVSAPIVNTGIYVIFMCTVLREYLVSSFGTNAVLGVLLTLIWANFLIEFAVCVLFSNAAFRVTTSVLKRY